MSAPPRPFIPARPAPPRPRAAWSWRNPVLRAWCWQACAWGAVLGGLAWLALNTQANLLARGIQSGWDFLGHSAGFDIGEHWIAFESSDTYARALLVGLVNTLRVAVLGIALSTLLGGLIGLGRLSGHPPLRWLCRAYVELFRNTPLLVQMLLCYLLLVERLPEAAEAWGWGSTVWLSKAGLALPWFAPGPDGWHWSRPVLDGLAWEGGVLLSPEFLAVATGLSLYTAAFVAEVVRAGLQAVPTGQHEAALSVGLSPRQTLWLVTGPQALRVVLPPLTNQYLNLTKNSSLAVAVGYPDLVSVANTSLNQTGRAMECLAVVMAVYLALSLLTAALMGWLDRRAARHGA